MHSSLSAREGDPGDQPHEFGQIDDARCVHCIVPKKTAVKIITVEGPVEYQMNTYIGTTFQATIRSIQRQAPNIIMIGETRDLETANIAINASFTGHLVFSTLYTNDTLSAVALLLDFSRKAFLVFSLVPTIYGNVGRMKNLHEMRVTPSFQQF